MSHNTTLRLEQSVFVFEATSHEVFFVVEIMPPLLVVFNNRVTEAERRLFQRVLMAFNLSRGRLVGGIT